MTRRPHPVVMATVVAVLVVLAVVAVRRGFVTDDTLIALAVLVPSVILHEVSHGAVALLFGDDTAKRAGRLTLNPVRHVDPLGTIILPAMLVLATGTGFGYAKPVPVNPGRMRSPRNHNLIVALAGPAVNVVLALVSALLARTLLTPGQLEVARNIPELASPLASLLLNLGVINVILAAFNLIPLPPLDGSAVVERLLPSRLWPAYLRMRQYSMGLLLALVLLVPGALTGVFRPALRLWASLLG
jgi:Zn-dependent protease